MNREAKKPLRRSDRTSESRIKRWTKIRTFFLCGRLGKGCFIWATPTAHTVKACLHMSNVSKLVKICQDTEFFIISACKRLADSPIVRVNTFWSQQSASTTPRLYATVKPTNGLCRLSVMDIYLTGIMAAAIENKETSLRVHRDSVLSVSQEPRDGFQHTSGLVKAACLVPVSAVSAFCWADSKRPHQCTLGCRHPLLTRQDVKGPLVAMPLGTSPKSPVVRCGFLGTPPPRCWWLGAVSIPKWIHKSLLCICVLDFLIGEMFRKFILSEHNSLDSLGIPSISQADKLVGSRIWRKCTVHQELRRFEFFLLCWEDSIHCLLVCWMLKTYYLYANDLLHDIFGISCRVS